MNIYASETNLSLKLATVAKNSPAEIAQKSPAVKKKFHRIPETTVIHYDCLPSIHPSIRWTCYKYLEEEKSSFFLTTHLLLLLCILYCTCQSAVLCQGIIHTNICLSIFHFRL